MALLVAGLVLFLGIHLVPALPPARLAVATRWGENRYKGAFSLISALGLVLIIAGYALSDDRTRVFAPLPAARAIAPYAMVVSFIMFAAANMKGHLRRSIRHPMLIGLLIWSTVHLLANGDHRHRAVRRVRRLRDRRSVSAVARVRSSRSSRWSSTTSSRSLAEPGRARRHDVPPALFGVPVVPFSV
jgi:hypothetical protein